MKDRFKWGAINMLFALLFINSFNALSQNKYSFIKKNLNRLHFSSDSSAFTAFCSRLEKLKNNDNKRINIVHIGGSHVQGGVWSNQLVGNFQSSFITGGGGYFVFPYRIAKTNSPPYATSFSNGKWKKCRSVGKEFCLPLGMSAMSITTNDSACNFGLALTDKAVCKYVNIVKVYHNFNNSFRFNLLLSDSFKVSVKDFKEKGFTQYTFIMPVDSVIFGLTRVDTVQKDFVIYGFSLENDLTQGFYLGALGANGATCNSFLRCAWLGEQLATLNGDLFILSLGVNDTQSKGFTKNEFIRSYDSLITLIQKVAPDAAIILTTTTDNYIRRKTSNKRTVAAKEAMFELMAMRNVAVWDLFSVMGGYRSIPKWYKAGLASRDKVHFSGKGYMIVGDLMYEAINNAYSNYLKSRQ
jgi:lysophospholipase L1-like esterase